MQVSSTSPLRGGDGLVQYDVHYFFNSKVLHLRRFFEKKGLGFCRSKKLRRYGAMISTELYS